MEAIRPFDPLSRISNIIYNPRKKFFFSISLFFVIFKQKKKNEINFWFPVTFVLI